MVAAGQGATDCVTLVLERGAYALDLNETMQGDRTALHLAAYGGHHHVISLLLHAGADPTIRDNEDQTALGSAQPQGHQECVALLEAALAEPQRTCALFKARALLDTAYAVRKARVDARDKEGLRTSAAINRRPAAAAPVYLQGRVAEGQEPLSVQVVEQGEQTAADEEQERLVACVKYALGLEGGGGVVLEWQEEPAVGMLPEVCVELLEVMVPKWDPARKGWPLGEGV